MRETELKENLKSVETRVTEACKRAGRNRDEVTLIAVSKTKPVEDLQVIYDSGIRSFGENKVQELTAKIPEMPEDIDWHLIGHLQRNKVKYIVDKVKLIHSVDSYRLAEEINIQAKKKGIVVPILIEVNAANEASKFGVRVEEAKQLCTEISHLDGVHIMGLMTIAPNVVVAEENRAIFHKIKDLSVDIDKENIDNVDMRILSMGMTNDFEVAIEEGATHVRVGTAIFGERNYNI
ncbi:YggS family pyridoxal phosphate-dependent enzyme [Pseudobutyrivibrio xylanivorans]|uniref:Pyridoxal phosphate homeostasis protein n=1 Tax=Pseudobutyrivibrio xylanivorans TaxID=185007 RepID=A0A5P6VUY8_PSEXY|nr:YggS family pyridoxal phosphate-dependent enzyme [Pseudobutyrivibrio xylanivorans]QFJ55609.1 YggS family pyridoxal phosphate-dependent enzyme [Pseudobutyrivibrio xylanivorans]